MIVTYDGANFPVRISFVFIVALRRESDRGLTDENLFSSSG